jgi:N-acetylglutamate synthase-like GNAT family acetyltransferase
VSPDARFRGVSKALVAGLEAKAVQLGVAAITLESTGTARRFYRSLGYCDAGDAVPGVGASLGYPMRKSLAAF